MDGDVTVPVAIVGLFPILALILTEVLKRLPAEVNPRWVGFIVSVVLAAIAVAFGMTEESFSVTWAGDPWGFLAALFGVVMYTWKLAQAIYDGLAAVMGDGGI